MHLCELSDGNALEDEKVLPAISRGACVGEPTMNPAITENTVLGFMRAEHARLSAVTADLWQALQAVEAELKPYKEQYDSLAEQWAASKRLMDALEDVIKAKTDV